MSIKDSEFNVIKSELEKIKQEKEGIQLKIENFDIAFKSLDKLLGCRITDKSKNGLGFQTYNVVPPPATLVYSTGSKDIPNEPKEYPDASLVKDRVSDNNDCLVESPVVIEKKISVPTIAKVEAVKPKQQEKPVRKTVRPRALNTARPRAVNTTRPNSTVFNAVTENQEFDGGYVTFGGEANGGRFTGKGTLKN
nr:hypothetical protein [Tanacetum cinerariifolium]